MNFRASVLNKQARLGRWLSIATLSSVLAVFSLGAYAEEINKSFDVGRDGTLKIDTDVGSIEIATHAAETVKVTVEIDGFDSDDFEVTFDHDGDSLSIEGDKRNNSSSWGRRSVHFDIVVPEQYNLSLDTSGGSIRVSDLKGQVAAKTSGGSLRFGNIAGDIKGRTSGGSIKVEEALGDVDIHTSGGSIHVGTVEGNVVARTSGGSITLGKVSGEANVKTSGGSIKVESVGGAITGKTSGGSIKVAMAKQPTGDTELRTSGGSVTVYLADDIAVDLEARGDKVKSDFEVNGKTKAKRKLHGPINGGGPKLELRTSSGTVYIKSM